MSTLRDAVVLFSDDGVAGLGPIVDLRPAFEVRVGALNLRERLSLCPSVGRIGVCESGPLPVPGVLEVLEDGEALRVNARLCGPVGVLDRELSGLAPGEAWRDGGELVASRGEPRIERALPGDLALVRHPWELLDHNDRLLESDIAALVELGGLARELFGIHFEQNSKRPAQLAAGQLLPAVNAGIDSRAVLVHADRIHLGDGAKIHPSAVIDATGGPVLLSRGVELGPQCVVLGPAYLGPGTKVNPGAKIREGVSAGAFCKLGGEIEESLLLDLSNKQHEGFLGHAIVGGWVNLGADTNGSDLKNNYSPVRVDLGSGPIESGRTFVGPLLGDHCKTGIDTMLGTGVVIGVASNVFGAGFVSGYVPPFSWGGADGLVEYEVDQAIRTARAVFARREVRFTREWERALRERFEASAEARARRGIR
jgi:UDP-N-acetylglucosamine diphosphorylase/glucosamine-1-phosphate N-acetyltransferase